MRCTLVVTILIGLVVFPGTALARYYQTGVNVYPGVPTPMPPMPMAPMPTMASASMPPAPPTMAMRGPGGMSAPMAAGFGRPHVAVNVYPAVPTPAPHPDGPNLYQYVRSNPVRYTDSSGLAVDPGKDCGLWSRSNHVSFIGPIKKPTHFWLNTDAGELWDFGPDYDWLDARYGNHEYGDCTIFKYCRGQANWGNNAYANRTGDVNNRPKLQLLGQIWFGSGKGTSCRCASCGDIKDCLSEVRRRWDGTRYDHFARHCGSFVLDAATWCCLWGV